MQNDSKVESVCICSQYQAFSLASALVGLVPTG